jgi:gamma-butyrobetaine dioxygenase
MPDPIQDLFDLLLREGGSSYHGEQVTQLEHALQAARAAEQAGASAALITAALLHDVGHLLTADTTRANARGEELGHEAVGADYLARWFPEAVTEPIRLHVPAKRYLCRAEPGYHAGLSAASAASLRVQGGPMTEAEAGQFRAHPHFEAALALRRWDEAAKVPGLATPDLRHFRQYVDGTTRGPDR